MARRLEHDLTAVVVLSIFLAIIVTFLPTNTLRVIVGVPFIIFFPGYALIAAVFPRSSDLGGVERAALSFGLSLAVVPIIGLILNYTPWGIRVYPMLASVALFIIVLSSAAWFRRRRLPQEKRFFVDFKDLLPRWSPVGRWDAVLTVGLVISIIAATGMTAYSIVSPRTGERFTEFYVLGLDGKAAGYPSTVAAGSEASVILGIVNREHENVTYQVHILIDGEEGGELGPLVLEHEEKWEEPVGFTPLKPAEHQKVEFLLFREEKEEPYRTLYLWVDVKENLSGFIIALSPGFPGADI